MRVAYGMPEAEMAGTFTVFDQEEIECLQHINKKKQCRTDKLCNPFNETKLAWAFWILSRLGGWRGCAAQRKAGSATLINGLKRFYNMSRALLLKKM